MTISFIGPYESLTVNQIIQINNLKLTCEKLVLQNNHQSSKEVKGMIKAKKYIKLDFRTEKKYLSSDLVIVCLNSFSKLAKNIYQECNSRCINTLLI